MLLSRCTDCETFSVRGLDNQLMHQMNLLRPGLLVRIDDLENVELGKSVHPWVQAPVRDCLIKAVKARGRKLIINSAFRTIAGQQLLRSHYENGRCGIVAAAPPGLSNHNNANAIDIEDPDAWRLALETNGFDKLGEWDDMHYDCRARGIIDIRSLSVIAFQQLWNLANPRDKLALDGDLGMLTLNRLRNAPIYGFADLPNGYPPRVLRLTDPLQAGNDVGQLQLSLRAAGIKLDRADKIFGKDTDRAVKEFQEKNNMTADGVVGAKTLLALGSSKDNTSVALK